MDNRMMAQFYQLNRTLYACQPLLLQLQNVSTMLCTCRRAEFTVRQVQMLTQNLRRMSHW